MFSRRFVSTSTLRPTIRQLLASTSETSREVQVCGWVRSVRRQKKVSFAAITDGSCPQGLQAVLSDSHLSKQLTNGASVRLQGVLTDSHGPLQDKELQVHTLQIIGSCDPETYPIQKQALSAEYLREHSHLRARTDYISAMLRLRDSVSRSLHQYFANEGFSYVHTPIITSNDCEGAGETFRIAPTKAASTNPGKPEEQEFFARPSFLTVSSQLHLETFASSLSRAYTLQPCFRAERSQTNRHLAEFWMLEAEWAFAENMHDICSVVESSVKTALRDHTADLDVLWKNRDQSSRRMLEAATVSEQPWSRISYAQAVEELERHQAASRKFKFQPAWGKPLQSEHERWLAEELIRGPVFVTDYPKALKPFYMRINDDDRTVACFDLLVPQIGELSGGSLREERLPILECSLDYHGLDKGDYRWYLDLRKYGGTPHGGFGLGFERLISWMGGIENIRECIPVPRWAGHILL